MKTWLWCHFLTSHTASCLCMVFSFSHKNICKIQVVPCLFFHSFTFQLSFGSSTPNTGHFQKPEGGGVVGNNRVPTMFARFLLLFYGRLLFSGICDPTSTNEISRILNWRVRVCLCCLIGHWAGSGNKFTVRVHIKRPVIHSFHWYFYGIFLIFTEICASIFGLIRNVYFYF